MYVDVMLSISFMLAIQLWAYNHVNKHNFRQKQRFIILLNGAGLDKKLIIFRCLNKNT